MPRRRGRTTRIRSSARREMNGLLVLQAMLGNSDLKDAQNALYKLKEPFEGAKQWYVARDLGQTFGRTGVDRCATWRPRRLRADAVHHRCRRRQSPVRLPRTAPRPLPEHHAGGRPLDLHAALPPDRRAVARRVSRRRLCDADRRSLHRADEAEDCRRPRAEGLMPHLHMPRSLAAILLALVLAPGLVSAQPVEGGRTRSRPRPSSSRSKAARTRSTRSTRSTRR